MSFSSLPVRTNGQKILVEWFNNLRTAGMAADAAVVVSAADIAALVASVALKAPLTSAALVTPSLGTPTAGVLTSCTGLPLTTGVTGALPQANGGTGQVTKAAAFDALSPNTTKGDITVFGTTNARLGVGTDGQIPIADSSQTLGVKWATIQAGTKNYVSYGTFENNLTTGWTATGCATITNGLPVSVGSGAAAFSSSNGGRTKGANTSSPAIDSSSAIAGTYCLNLATTGAGTIGDGYISSPYTIDKADQAKVMAYKVYYKSASGAPVMAGTSANTYGIAIYDVVNNSWLGVAGGFNFIQSSGCGIAQGSFQTASNTTSIQLFVYSPVAPVGASSLLFDDVFIGPQSLAFGPAMSDMTQWTPIFNGFGTCTNINFWSRRNGDCLEGYGSFTAGTPTATLGYVTLGYNGANSNVTVDSSKFTTLTIVGQGNDSSVSSNCPIFNVYSNGGLTYLTFGARDTSSGFGGYTERNGNALVVNGEKFGFFFRVPISGWSSNTVMSADSSTRVIGMSATGTSTSITSSAPTVVFSSVVKDVTGTYSNSTGLYTVGISGLYFISSNITSGSVAHGANSQLIMSYKLNGGAGVEIGRNAIGAAATQAFGLSGSTLLQLNAGDTIGIACYSSTTNTPTSGNFCAFLLSGPAVVAASETVGALYGGTPTGTLAASYNAVTFPTKISDTHAAMSGATYTIPTPGLYDISAQTHVGGTFSAGNAMNLALFVNGVQKYQNPGAANSTVGICCVPFNIKSFPLNAGDAVQMRIYAATGAGLAFDTSGTQCWFSIAKTGN